MNKPKSDAITQTAQSHNAPIDPRRFGRNNVQMVQNVLLIWLDSNIDHNHNDCRDIINHLRRAMNTIHTFKQSEECIQFLEKVVDEKACMIISGSLGQKIMSRVHDLSPVDSIFIFCSNKSYHEGWTKNWPKIKGVFTAIQPICDGLKQVAQQCEQNAISISIMGASDVVSKQNLDQLDPSFIYTQIMKEILLTIQFEQQHIQEFIEHCREVFAENVNELKYTEQLARTYRQYTPIWWYTCECFLYPMLNRALRTMDVDVIIKLGFFICDLHRQITQVHKEQFANYSSNQNFTVYRGQGMEKKAFETMTASKGGLLSFNCFLSTSKNRQVAFKFAEHALVNTQMVGVVFVMTINPARSSIPFGSVTDVGYLGALEDEVLFSMHTIFRIEQITSLRNNTRLFQVELTLINNNKDNDLRQLIDRIREETFPKEEGWFRLGLVLGKMAEFAKAQQVFEDLLNRATEENARAPICQQLGVLMYAQGAHKKAIKFHMESIKIRKKQIPCNHKDLATAHNDIGKVYYSVGAYQEALSSHKQALTIQQQSLSSTHPDLAASHNNIGNVYASMGHYPKALSSYKEALTIRQQALPSTHPDIAATHGNIGNVYKSVGDYQKALSSYEKALEIHRQSLPPTHPDLAKSYNNIGNVYDNMGNYSKALSSYEETLAIQCQSLPVNHPDLAMCYNNIGLVYNSLGKYPKALSYYEKALKIREKSLPSTHPDLAVTYSNMGLVYENMSNYSEAQLCYERAVCIAGRSLPPDHPKLQKYRKNVTDIKKKLK